MASVAPRARAQPVASARPPRIACSVAVAFKSAVAVPAGAHRGLESAPRHPGIHRQRPFFRSCTTCWFSGCGRCGTRGSAVGRAAVLFCTERYSPCTASAPHEAVDLWIVCCSVHGWFAPQHVTCWLRSSGACLVWRSELAAHTWAARTGISGQTGVARWIPRIIAASSLKTRLKRAGAVLHVCLGCRRTATATHRSFFEWQRRRAPG